MISIKKSKYYNLKNIPLILCLAILSLNLNQPSLAENAQQNQNLTLDIDGDGEFDALTDGLLVIRSMFGLSGDALIDGVLGQNAQRSSSNEIEQRIVLLGNKLDVDGNGQVDALTDGLLTLRFLFGLSGCSVTPQSDDGQAGGVDTGKVTQKPMVESAPAVGLSPTSSKNMPKLILKYKAGEERARAFHAKKVRSTKPVAFTNKIMLLIF